MAQSLLTQYGVEYGSTMRTLQGSIAKKHVTKKWRSRNQSSSSSSSSQSFSSSGSEDSSRRSSVEREFSIVKEGSFANGPLKLKIAARRIKKDQAVAGAGFANDNYLVESPSTEDNPHRDVGVGQVTEAVASCSVQVQGKKQCKRKIEKKHCLQTKDPRVPCSGQYSSCKTPRSSRRCSTSGSSSSSSSSSSSTGSSGSSSSGSSSGSSTGCSSGSSTGSSSSGSSSTSGSSSSSSSSSGSSTCSESESCCKYGRCRRRRRRKNKLRSNHKTSTKCQATSYTLPCDQCSISSCSNSHSKRLSDKTTGGKRTNKKLQANEIDYFTISSSDDEESEQNTTLQDCFSMWRKVEEEHCTIIGRDIGFKNDRNSDVNMQVLSVTNAEVECNINIMGKVGLVSRSEEKHLIINNSNSENPNNMDCDYNFSCLEKVPSIVKERTVHRTNLDLDALPISNVSPDSGIQSSGDSPLRIECDLSSASQSKITCNQTSSRHDNINYYTRTSCLSELSVTSPNKHVSPTPSPPILTPPEPLWTQSTDAQSSIEKVKSIDDHQAPLLVQENLGVKINEHNNCEDKVNNLESQKNNTKHLLHEKDVTTMNNHKTPVPLLSTESNSERFSSNSLHLIFQEQNSSLEKSVTSVFDSDSSLQIIPSSETRRHNRNRQSRRNVETNLKADNELQMLVQSVQDSISSQFQGVESDELSDVDVNSIPVTALTCDATSDSFCDKLSNEDNIDMFLGDRACITDEQKGVKTSDASKISTTGNIENDDFTSLSLTLPEKENDECALFPAKIVDKQNFSEPICDSNILCDSVKSSDITSKVNENNMEVVTDSSNVHSPMQTIDKKKQRMEKLKYKEIDEIATADKVPEQLTNTSFVSKDTINNKESVRAFGEKNINCSKRKSSKKGRQKFKGKNLSSNIAIKKLTECTKHSDTIRTDKSSLFENSKKEQTDKEFRFHDSSNKSIVQTKDLSSIPKSLHFIEGVMSDNLDDYKDLLEIPVIITDDKSEDNSGPAELFEDISPSVTFHRLPPGVVALNSPVLPSRQCSRKRSNGSKMKNSKNNFLPNFHQLSKPCVATNENTVANDNFEMKNDEEVSFNKNIFHDVSVVKEEKQLSKPIQKEVSSTNKDKSIRRNKKKVSSNSANKSSEQIPSIEEITNATDNIIISEDKVSEDVGIVDASKVETIDTSCSSENKSLPEMNKHDETRKINAQAKSTGKRGRPSKRKKLKNFDKNLGQFQFSSINSVIEDVANSKIVNDIDIFPEIADLKLKDEDSKINGSFASILSNNIAGNVKKSKRHNTVSETKHIIDVLNNSSSVIDSLETKHSSSTLVKVKRTNNESNTSISNESIPIKTNSISEDNCNTINASRVPRKKSSPNKTEVISEGKKSALNESSEIHTRSEDKKSSQRKSVKSNKAQTDSRDSAIKSVSENMLNSCATKENCESKPERNNKKYVLSTDQNILSKEITPNKVGRKEKKRFVEETENKNKKTNCVRDRISEKMHNSNIREKSPKKSAPEKTQCLEPKQRIQELSGNISKKINKKGTKKSKVYEEKENFILKKKSKSFMNKSESKHIRGDKTTLVNVLLEDTKKDPIHLNAESSIDMELSERDSVALSSLSINDDAYSDACLSSGLDRHSSLDLKPPKKKKNLKTKYSNNPSFLADLDILVKLLKSCYISKKQAKPKDNCTNDKLPPVFQLKFCIKGKNDKISRVVNLIKSSKVSKPRIAAASKKKLKRLKHRKGVKLQPCSKPEVTVDENCLPLKKRRCQMPANGSQATKPVATEVPPSKTPLSKRISNSFDLSIEECIRKHMLSDEVPSEKVVVNHVTKLKPKPTKSLVSQLTINFDSYYETIDECVKDYATQSEENFILDDISKEIDDDAEDIPLATLVSRNKKVAPPAKRKIQNTTLAYKQKRKRIIKEATAQAQQKSQGDIVVNGQKKKRRIWNKTGFVRVRKKRTKPILMEQSSQIAEVTPDNNDKDIVDLTSEEAVLNTIECVVKGSNDSESSRSRRKRKNVAHKCEIEVLDIASGNDDNDIECIVTKKQKLSGKEEQLEPKLQQIIQVTEPSSGHRSILNDPRKQARRKEVQYPKKKFLRAALYSAYYKQDPPPVKKSSKKSRSREVKEYIPEDHEFGLMPMPIHVGRFVQQNLSDYKLPFDMWWLYKNKQLVYNDELTNNYKKIRTNVYVDIKPDTKSDNHQACMCIPPKDHRRKGCGLECLNRMMYVECVPLLCPCKDQCSNQRIFKHEWSPGLERFMTRDRGWGIRTTEFIRSGEFILEYVGEVVSDIEFRHRMAERYRNDQHHYCLSLDSGTVIDGYRLAGEGRFVNHSCEPNCEMQKWYVNGHYRVGLFSLRDIFPNTELCYDYNFVNYNLETQQICRCSSAMCRGFIGGRSQRLNGQAKEKVRQVKQSKAIIDSKKGPGRPKKRKDEKPVEIQKEQIKNEYLPYNRQSFMIQMKPMSHQQRCYVQKHHCFLLRNYEKVKQAKDNARATAEKEAERENAVDKLDAFHAQFTALNTARSVKTRRLANAEEHTELTKTAKLAQVFKDIFTAVTSCKGDDGTALATPFFQIPSKRKNPDYYTKIKFPIDFTTIEKNIITGQYGNVDAFEDDFLRLFENAEEYYGRTSDMGHKISLLRKVYDGAKTDAMILFEDILGDSMSSMFSSKSDEKNDEDDEVIRCICNIYKDEGLMIQCEKCFVWQHCDCVGVDGKVEKYLCEQCSGVELSKEILIVPRPHYANPECQYYLTMLLGELQIKQGDCVYLRREEDGATSVVLQTQMAAQGMEGEDDDAAARDSLRSKKEQDANSDQLDIFRVERLWKDEKCSRFVFGHHYLRPHETYHEPSRKFFPNEVFRVPLYEILPLECIVGMCCVLDLPTYCKGKPKGFKEEDIYICEYRVDKTAHLFNKASKVKYPICTKKYAFEHFEKRKNPKRTFIPHTVPSEYLKKDRSSSSEKKCSKIDSPQKEDKKKRGAPKEIDTRLEESPESREQKRTHLNELLLGLLRQMPTKQTVDLSYLLEKGLGKRNRRKPALS